MATAIQPIKPVKPVLATVKPPVTPGTQAAAPGGSVTPGTQPAKPTLPGQPQAQGAQQPELAQPKPGEKLFSVSTDKDPTGQVKVYARDPAHAQQVFKQAGGQGQVSQTAPAELEEEDINSIVGILSENGIEEGADYYVDKTIMTNDARLAEDIADIINQGEWDGRRASARNHNDEYYISLDSNDDVDNVDKIKKTITMCAEILSSGKANSEQKQQVSEIINRAKTQLESMRRVKIQKETNMTENNKYSATDDVVKFALDTERAYQAVMARFGDIIDYDENEGTMTVPERIWPKVEMVAFDADGIGAIRTDDDRDPYAIDEALKFTRGHPDVDHMTGQIIRNADMTTDNVEAKSKQDWIRAVNSINTKVFDDESEFVSNSQGATVTGNDVVWAKWDNKTQTGWFNAKGRPVKPHSFKKQSADEGVAGGLVGGAAGALATKTPQGAMAGYKIGSAMQDAFSKDKDSVGESKHGLNKRVRIVGGPADVRGKIGTVGEVRHGSFKGAPKTYTVDYEDDTGSTHSIQLKATDLRLVKESVTESKMKIKNVAEAKNHMGETEYQTYPAWKRACKAAGATSFTGDKDIDQAMKDKKAVGEWDGAVGSVYDNANKTKKVAEATKEITGGRVHTAEPGGYGRRADDEELTAADRKRIATKKKAEKATQEPRGRGRPKKDTTSATSSSDAGKALQSWIVGNVPAKSKGLEKLPKTKHKMKDDKDDMDEGNEFTGALAAAKASGKKEFTVGGKKHTVKESMLQVQSLKQQVTETMKQIQRLPLEQQSDPRISRLISKLEESVGAAVGKILNESHETLDHICRRFPAEVKNFARGEELDSDLYDALFDYYSQEGEMPYGVAKARTGDPFEWVSSRFEEDVGNHYTEKEPRELEEGASKEEMQNSAETMTLDQFCSVYGDDEEVTKFWHEVNDGQGVAEDDQLPTDVTSSDFEHNPLGEVSGANMFMTGDVVFHDNRKGTVDRQEGDKVFVHTGPTSMDVWPASEVSLTRQGMIPTMRKSINQIGRGMKGFMTGGSELEEGAKEDMSKEVKAMATGTCPHCHGPVKKTEHATLTQYHCAKCGIRASQDKQGVAEGSEWETRHDEFVTVGDRATPEQINKIVSALTVAAKEAGGKRGFLNQIVGKQSNGDLARQAHGAEILAKNIQRNSNAKPGTDERKELGQHLVYAVSLLKRMKGEQDVAEGRAPKSQEVAKDTVSESATADIARLVNLSGMKK